MGQKFHRLRSIDHITALITGQAVIGEDGSTTVDTQTLPENCFADIYQQIIQLPPTDQLYLKSSAIPLFQGLMESDGLEGIEQERLDHLMRYIRESLGNA